MKDIFDIQDEVAEKVVEGLKLHLTTAEQKKLLERGTENDEAYTLAMKAREYNNIGTRDSLLAGVKLASDAIELDSKFAHAYYVKTFALLELYRHYDRDPALLQEAEALAKHALELKPDYYIVYINLMTLYWLQGNSEKAEFIAKEYVRLAPNDYRSYFALATYCIWIDKFQDAVSNYEHVLEQQPDHLIAYQNICLAASNLANKEIVKKWSERALPHFEKHLRFSPDDHLMNQWYAFMLYWSGNLEKAKEIVDLLLEKKDLDPKIIYNIASYQLEVEPLAALESLRRSVEAGFIDVKEISGWRNLDQMRSNPDHLRELEDIIQLAMELQSKTHG
jgi:adenylate cyclase